MIESETKKNWCPFAGAVHSCNNVLNVSFHVANRGIDGSLKDVCCLGMRKADASACFLHMGKG